jgi:hypothetical protein
MLGTVKFYIFQELEFFFRAKTAELALTQMSTTSRAFFNLTLYTAYISSILSRALLRISFSLENSCSSRIAFDAFIEICRASVLS